LSISAVLPQTMAIKEFEEGKTW